jgi:hypothetical protein
LGWIESGSDANWVSEMKITWWNRFLLPQHNSNFYMLLLIDLLFQQSVLSGWRI